MNHIRLLFGWQENSCPEKALQNFTHYLENILMQQKKTINLYPFRKVVVHNR